MSRHVVSMTIEDVDHYTREEKDRIIASYPAHERDARAKGIPTMGSGRVFPIAEERIKCDPITIPKHWAQINGTDFGYDHPFAAVNIAWDRDADCIYVAKAYRQREATPIIHAASIKPWGSWVPCAWPHDGYQHDKGSGDQLAEQYRKQGLKMLREHATHPEGGFGTEAGIMEMLDRMQTDRFKVFATLGEWFDEFRLYHRKDGKIVKERDDLMSATRIGLMMLRFAATEPVAWTAAPSRGGDWMGV
jgi:Terminase RNaseH-like domain/Terminase large subunit, T4likevirus-type, N-terminal